MKYIAFLFLSSFSVFAWVDPNYDKVSKANDKYRKDKFEDAQKIYEKLLPNQKGKNKAITHYNIANSYLKQKQYQKALKHYNEATKYNNKTIRQKAYNNMGTTYAKMGNTKAALQSYLSALNESNDPEVRRNIERLFRKQKNQDQNKDQKDQNGQNQDQKKKNQSNKDKKQQNQQAKGQQNESDSTKSEEKKKLAERIIREASRNKVQRRHGKGGGPESKPY